MSQKETAKKVSDNPLLPSIGTIRPNVGSHEALLYYRNLIAGNGLEIIKAEKDITIGIAQSVNNSIDKFDDVGVVFFDEVHHLAATTFFKISEGLAFFTYHSNKCCICSVCNSSCG